MPFVEVNNIQLYYEAFGELRPDQVPLLLIHGATGTGRSNWSLVAPLLARRHYVIVPDCRGHGQSTNPAQSYSFKEMASDMVAMLYALGFERAHLIGHSNGGNVALVTLLEHPQAVQSAVLQAANAFVSPDLIEKEPAVFDPDRVAREDPDWVAEMQRLHAFTHGSDYWRNLLRMTVLEIIREPNYTSQDLAKVQRPVLVIQGQQDRVNAPARHAQFIAHSIPDAELWLPAEVGHNVHDERLFAWVERVLDFLERRGDDLNDRLYRLRQAYFCDSRETIFQVHADLTFSASNNHLETPRQMHLGQLQLSQVHLSGQVLYPEQRRLAEETLVDSGIPLLNEIYVLLDSSTPWAQVTCPVVDLRREPRLSAERLSQGLLGEAVRILEQRQDWVLVRMERDGYLGWIQSAGLRHCLEKDFLAYQTECNAIVIADLLPARLPAPVPVGLAGMGREAGKLPFGVPVSVENLGEASPGSSFRPASHSGAVLTLPDGRRWIVDPQGLLPLSNRPCTDPAGIAFSLALFFRFIGVPYLWGGRTPFGFDCSGLAGAFLNFFGIDAPRDADQLFRFCRKIEGPPAPGDLLFFGEPIEAGDPNRYPAVSHIGISLGGTELLHANSAAASVSYNSMDPESPLYRPWLRENLLGIGTLR